MEIDKQGRTVLPGSLRDYAAIDKDVIVIGVGSRAEIWAVENWEKYIAGAEASYEDIAASLVDLGI